MKQGHNFVNRKGERGNVLFLILIAVAMFAALSYAVTSSSRSGGGDASSETNLISSAQITQYPAAVRTAIVRMIIGGAQVTDLEFNPPSDFTNLSDSGGGTKGFGVFHPDGGGATYATIPPDVMSDAQQGTWTFNGDFEVVNIGVSSGTSADGNDVIAFLPGIKESICSRINKELGIATTPIVTASVAGVDPGTPGYLRVMDNATKIPASEIIIGTGGAAGTNMDDLDGQPYGCFRNTSTGEFVYYHVIIER